MEARRTWSTDVGPLLQFVDGSLEALRPRLSAGLPLSVERSGGEVRVDRVRLSSGSPAFGGPTGMALNLKREC